MTGKGDSSGKKLWATPGHRCPHGSRSNLVLALDTARPGVPGCPRLAVKTPLPRGALSFSRLPRPRQRPLHSGLGLLAWRGQMTFLSSPLPQVPPWLVVPCHALQPRERVDLDVLDGPRPLCISSSPRLRVPPASSPLQGPGSQRQPQQSLCSGAEAAPLLWLRSATLLSRCPAARGNGTSVTTGPGQPTASGEVIVGLSRGQMISHV